MDAEAQSLSQEISENIQEEFPPEFLFKNEALEENHTIYSIIRDYLVLHGRDYTPSTERRRVAW